MSRAPITSGLLAFVLAAGLSPPGRAAPPSPNAEAVRLRRFALMIGVNDGGASRAKLRYAASDARSMARALESLGGVAPADLVFVATPGRAATMQGFAQIEALMRAGRTPRVRTELLVYYSGHSDEDGLLLGDDRISYEELRGRIKQLPADLRVAILDSCASGAFTRRKGGVRRPPFLVDASADMRGHAFLTSSAANEVAQESDRIAASFFTHYLVSGLRGAADVNQDRRVTLQEAYQFASQETLARTERTTGGPQHAAYEFDLSGSGDMVVTGVRATQASLVLTPELSGRITVRESGGALVAELRKPAGNTVELGVEAGTYVIAMEAAGGTMLEAQATLSAGQRAALARLTFHPGRPPEVAIARGDGPGAGAESFSATKETTAPDVVSASAPPPMTRDLTRLRLGILPRSGDERADVDGLSLGLVGDRAGRVTGVQMALGYALIDRELHGVQLAVGATIARGTSRGLQLASGAAIADSTFHGVQLAGTVNGARDMQGLQLAGAVNVAEKTVGLQLAPVNLAGQQDGTQVGVVNYVQDGGGFRLGVVNVARHTSGFQFGVVNVAGTDDGESFALLNLIGNGIHDVIIYASDAMLTNLGVKLGGRHLYTVIGASYQPGDAPGGQGGSAGSRGGIDALPGAMASAGAHRFERGTRRWATDLGVGWRFGLHFGRLENLELEAHSANVYETWSVSGTAPMLNALRLQATVALAPHVALLAGVSGNVMVGLDGSDLDLSLGGPEKVIHSGATTVRIYPGFLLGVQI